jgi:hypothetical protein
LAKNKYIGFYNSVIFDWFVWGYENGQFAGTLGVVVSKLQRGPQYMQERANAMTNSMEVSPS